MRTRFDFSPRLRISTAAGLSAAILVTIVEAVFRKPLADILGFSLELGVCAFLATALVGPAFLRLAARQLPAAFLLASLALGLTYLAFGVFNAINEMVKGSTEPLSVFIGLPVFVLFSLPLALPIALFLAWYFLRYQAASGNR